MQGQTIRHDKCTFIKQYKHSVLLENLKMHLHGAHCNGNIMVKKIKWFQGIQGILETVHIRGEKLNR